MQVGSHWWLHPRHLDVPTSSLLLDTQNNTYQHIGLQNPIIPIPLPTRRHHTYRHPNQIQKPATRISNYCQENSPSKLESKQLLHVNHWTNLLNEFISIENSHIQEQCISLQRNLEPSMRSKHLKFQFDCPCPLFSRHPLSHVCVPLPTLIFSF